MPQQRGGGRVPTPDEVRQQVIRRLRAEQARQRAIDGSMAAARARIAKQRRQKQASESVIGLTLRRLAVASIGLFFIVLLTTHLGFHLPSLSAASGDSSTSSTGEGNGGPPAPAAPVSDEDKISITEAVPCAINTSPRINLTTNDRVEACNKAKRHAKSQLLQRFGATEGERQFLCQDVLWENESRWSPWAINLSSGAYGIAQALPSAQGNVYAMGDWKAQVEWRSLPGGGFDHAAVDSTTDRLYVAHPTNDCVEVAILFLPIYARG